MKEKIIQIGETEELLNPMLDPIFKALFTSEDEKSREALKDLISTCINEEVESVQIASNEPAVDMLEEKQIRYDINCVINTGEKVNVEMTIFPSKGEVIRLEYYLTKLFSSQKTSGAKKWDELKKVYQISIIGEERLFKDEKMVHNFEYYDKEQKISLDGKTRLITIELLKLNENEKLAEDKLKNIKLWATFFKYASKIEKRTVINDIAKEEKGVNMALQVLTSLSKDEKMRMIAISEEKRLNDYQMDLNTEKDFSFRVGREKGLEEGISLGRISGLEEGRKSGLEEGRKSGLEEGRKSGLEEGRRLENKEMLRKMKLLGLSDEIIQSIIDRE